MQVQHTTEGVAHAPDRFGLLLQVMYQLIDQVLPVVIDREARVMAVLWQVEHPVVRCKRGKQLAIGRRRKAVGMGEEDLLRHGRLSVGE
ncbi:hypothetical protein D3C84_943010 [compost metagenome]